MLFLVDTYYRYGNNGKILREKHMKKITNKDVLRVYNYAITQNPMDFHGLGTTSATFQSGYKFGLNGHIDGYTKYGKNPNTKLYALYHAGIAVAKNN